MREHADNNKPVNITLKIGITFYEEETGENEWGSDDIAFEMYWNSKNGILNLDEVGAFGDRTLIKRFQDRRGRGISLKEMLENIEEISQMTYREFKEAVGLALLKGDTECK